MVPERVLRTFAKHLALHRPWQCKQHLSHNHRSNCPGVDYAYVCKRVQIALCMTMYELSQLQSWILMLLECVMRMFANDFKEHRPWQCKHRPSYNHKFWWSWIGSCVRLQTVSNSIVHDNVSIVSAIIIDFYDPGLGNANVCERFQTASAMPM